MGQVVMNVTVSNACPVAQLGPNATIPDHRDAAASAGHFGPDAYRLWRANRLGTITEAIERRLILQLAGEMQGRSVLDAGCGDGALPLALWERGARCVTGFDSDPRMIARARADAARHNARISYLLANAERLPFRDQTFDLVTMITVLAFVQRPEMALREIARVLKPDGQLVIGDLGRWNLWAASRRLRAWLGRAPMWNAATFRSARQLRALVEGAGLHPDRITGAVYYPRSLRVARIMAPLDPWLGELTTFGAAFVALRSAKGSAPRSH